MNLFDTAMTAIGKPAMRAAFGSDATFTPQATGAAIATWVMPATDQAFAGQFGERPEARRLVDLPVSDVPEPQPGDILSYGGSQYRIDQLLDHDEWFYSVALR